jgi:hypothetical protein
MNHCINNDLIIKNQKKITRENFTSRGFALVYSDKSYKKKIVSNKLDERSLIIFQKNLKKNTQVKVTNILNKKTLIAKVGKKTNYPPFYNSVVSLRIASELEINEKEPYIEIVAISENSLFIAKKAKTFDEEKEVANKVPVNNISIDNLKVKKVDQKKIIKNEFFYIIKLADFYFKDTALVLVDRINDETSVAIPKIKMISSEKYRVYLGPFKSINSLQKSYNDIKILEFENIEIIKND